MTMPFKLYHLECCVLHNVLKSWKKWNLRKPYCLPQRLKLSIVMEWSNLFWMDCLAAMTKKFSKNVDNLAVEIIMQNASTHTGFRYCTIFLILEHCCIIYKVSTFLCLLIFSMQLNIEKNPWNFFNSMHRDREFF